MRRGRPSKVSDRFWQLYKQGLSDRQIARELSVSRRTVLKWRHRQGLSANYICHRGKFPFLKDKFLELRLQGFSIFKIAEELGISPSTAHTWLKKLGLRRLRRLQRLQRLRSYNKKRLETLRLYKKGYSYEEIAETLRVSLKKVQIWIGFYLMEQCRSTPTCPMKALLPEYNMEVSK